MINIAALSVAILSSTKVEQQEELKKKTFKECCF